MGIHPFMCCKRKKCRETVLMEGSFHPHKKEDERGTGKKQTRRNKDKKREDERLKWGEKKKKILTNRLTQ